MAIEKIKIPGAVLELPAKHHCQFSPFGPTSEVNGLDCQCCLAGSSKTAPGILIFSIAMGADYSFYAPAFLRHNNSVLARVYRVPFKSLLREQIKWASDRQKYLIGDFTQKREEISFLISLLNLIFAARLQSYLSRLFKKLGRTNV